MQIPEWKVKANVMAWRRKNAEHLAHNPKPVRKPEPVDETDAKIVAHYMAKQALTQKLPL